MPAQRCQALPLERRPVLPLLMFGFNPDAGFIVLHCA
jgi:hypothetical protein